MLASIADAKDVASALDSYEPHTPGYLALKAKLAEIRAGKTDQGKPAIAGGPVLKIGMQDDRVPELRERLGVLGDGGTTYDKALAEAVKKFQKEHQIAVTGTLTAATVDAHQRPAARSRRGRHHRQYGTLALGAARFPGYLRHRQPARLHAARHA